MRFKYHWIVLGEFSFLHSLNLSFFVFHPSFISLRASIFPLAISFFLFLSPFHSFSFHFFHSSVPCFFFLFSVSHFSLPPFFLDFFLSFLLYLIPLNSLFLSLSCSDFIRLSIINHWPCNRFTEVI